MTYPIGTKLYRLVWLSNGTPVIRTFTVIKSTQRTFWVRNQRGHESRGDNDVLMKKSLDAAIVEAIREECREGTHWWERLPLNSSNKPRDPREVLDRFAQISRLVRKLEKHGLIGGGA